MYEQTTSEGKNPQLWHMARKRASFKRHLALYIIVNVFLWLVWYLSGSRNYDGGIPWPLWTTFGWGIGLAFHYMSPI